MREPEERPGLPLWLPEPYHGPQPPGGFPPARKPKKKPANQRSTGRRASSRASQRPTTIIRVAAVVVGAAFATVITLITIISQR